MDYCRCKEPQAAPVKPEPLLFPGMASFLIQGWEDILPPEKALLKGTVFPSLSKPFFAGGEPS